MTSQTFVLLSGTLTFGVPMALALWDLLTIPGPHRRGDEPPPKERRVPAPRPLPQCLQPVRFPALGPVAAKATTLAPVADTVEYVSTQTR